jgi:hypothetical protein
MRSLLDIFGNRRELGAKVREHQAPIAIGTAVGAAALLAAYLVHRYGKSPTPEQIAKGTAVMELLAVLRDFEYTRDEETKHAALVAAPKEVRNQALREFPAFVTLFRPDNSDELAMLVSAVCDVPECIAELDDRQARALVGS